MPIRSASTLRSADCSGRVVESVVVGVVVGERFA